MFLKTFRSILIYILQGLFSDVVSQNLRSTAATTGSFHPAHLLPHGAEAIAEAAVMAQAAALRNVQSMLEEDPTKMNRVNTKNVCTSVIRDRHTVHGACANGTVLVRTLAEFDETSIVEDKVPFLHLVARKLAIVITSTDYDTHQLTNPNTAPQLDHYVFNLFNRVVVSYTSVLSDETSISAARPSNASTQVHQINTAPLILATNALERGLLHVASVIANSETLEVPAIYLNSPFEAAALKAAEAHRATSQQTSPTKKSPATKKQKVEDKRTGSNPGPLNCTAALIPMPTTWPTGEKELCMAALRNNSKGCQNPRCEKNEDPPSSWPASVLTLMKAHVAQTACLSWNSAVVPPELLDMKLTKSNTTTEVP